MHKQRFNRKSTRINTRALSKGISSDTTEMLYQQGTRGTVRIPKRVFAPPSLIVDLMFIDKTAARTNAGFAFCSWRYRMNSVFDPDPGFLTGAVAGHAEWSAFYFAYRVLRLQYSITISNREIFPIDVITCPTNLDIGNNFPTPLDLAMQPYSRITTVGSINGDATMTFNGAIDLGTFYGNVKQYIGDDAFGSAITTNPITMNYLNIALQAPAPLSSGVMLSARLIYSVAYYDRNNLAS
jgi:hypothetical protein